MGVRRKSIEVGAALDYRGQDLGDVFALERRRPGQHLVEHEPNAQMSARLSTLALGLLRAHVCGSAEDHPARVVAGDVSVGECRDVAASRRRRLERLRQAEVEHLHGAVGPHLDVGGLQVAMDDALSCAASSASAICRAIGSASSSGIGPRDRSASVSPSTSSMTSAERPPALLEAVDRGDVRMVQRREDLRFALEAGEPSGSARRARAGP